MSGRFKWVWSTALKYDEWNCKGTKRVPVEKLTKAQTEVLLSYVNQTLPSRPRPPHFCTDCYSPHDRPTEVSQVQVMCLGLQMESDSTAGQYSAKRQKLHHSYVSAIEWQQIEYIDSSTDWLCLCHTKWYERYLPGYIEWSFAQIWWNDLGSD